MQLQQLSELMKTYGIVGAGGAGFPSYAKLSDKADTLILNCAECEPLLKLHRQLLEKYAFEILTALQTVKEAVAAKQVVVGIKGSYKKTVEAVEAVLSQFPDTRIARLPEVYPSGDEIVLIYEATGRVIAPGELPISKGVIVYNVETMLNLYHALDGVPVTHKYVTVAGAVKNPVTLQAAIGTPFSALIRAAGGETCDDPAYISGGPMTGRITSPYEVVTKTTNAVLVLPEESALIQKKKSNPAIGMKRAMSSCCQCQMCTDLCPRHLLGHPIQPHLFMRSASTGVIQKIQPMLDTMYCCGCGVCELFACPQGLHPKSLIEVYKAGLRAQGIKPEKQAGGSVKDARKWRKVSSSRLKARLGLSQYDVPAPLSDEKFSVKQVKILLSQHIGAPAKAIVKKGDRVEMGQKIGVCEGLGADIYASVSGTVTACSAQDIVIKREEGM